MSDKEKIKEVIKNASREHLVLMLYDGAIRFAEKAKELMEKEDYEQSFDLNIKSQNIVLELLYALDRKTGGEISENLAGLYTYSYNRLVGANVNKDSTKIDEALAVLKGLRNAWKEAVERIEKNKEKSNHD